jgi:cell division protein FtsL
LTDVITTDLTTNQLHQGLTYMQYDMNQLQLESTQLQPEKNQLQLDLTELQLAKRATYINCNSTEIITTNLTPLQLNVDQLQLLVAI